MYAPVIILGKACAGVGESRCNNVWNSWLSL